MGNLHDISRQFNPEEKYQMQTILHFLNSLTDRA